MFTFYVYCVIINKIHFCIQMTDCHPFAKRKFLLCTTSCSQLVPKWMRSTIECLTSNRYNFEYPCLRSLLRRFRTAILYNKFEIPKLQFSSFFCFMFTYFYYYVIIYFVILPYGISEQHCGTSHNMLTGEHSKLKGHTPRKVVILCRENFSSN